MYTYMGQTFLEPGISDYVVCYMRILTSGYLQSNSEFFEAFVEGGRTVKEYCSEVYTCSDLPVFQYDYVK